MIRRPLRKEPQLLVIPNLPAVTAAFNRACTENVDLIALELERVRTGGEWALGSGWVLQMAAFLRSPSLTLVHIVRGAADNPRAMIEAAEALGVNAGYQARRRRTNGGF